MLVFFVKYFIINIEKNFYKIIKKYIIAKVERTCEMDKTICELFAGVGGFRIRIRKSR